MKPTGFAILAAAAAMVLAPSVLARTWEKAGQGWHFDPKDVKIELKDGVVNTENTVVFQMHQDDSGAKPAGTAEPTAQLYLLCESRQYRLWDVKSSSQIGPISTSMFDVAQTLEAYCDRIGKLPEERKKGPGQR
jgi:hypothetical protein